MAKYTKEELLAKYNALPQELKAAMSSVESSDVIQEIGKKYNLRVDQIGELASETGYLLIGITKPGDYIKNLKQQLQIDLVKARDIALEVNEKIFSKVKESLKKIHNLYEESGEKPPLNETQKETKPPVELTLKHAPEKQEITSKTETEKNYFQKLSENRRRVFPLRNENIEDKNLSKTAPENKKGFEQSKEKQEKTAEQDDKEKTSFIIQTQESERRPPRETKINLNEKKEDTAENYKPEDPYREPL